eukprot:6332113-Lingulodinium_polyedra.AAC.1
MLKTCSMNQRTGTENSWPKSPMTRGASKKSSDLAPRNPCRSALRPERSWQGLPPPAMATSQRRLWAWASAAMRSR